MCVLVNMLTYVGIRETEESREEDQRGKKTNKYKK